MSHELHSLFSRIVILLLLSLFGLGDGGDCSYWPTANVQPKTTLGNIHRWVQDRCDPTNVEECDFSDASNCFFFGPTLAKCRAIGTTIVAEASERVDSCCPRGHSIAEWKIAYTMYNSVGVVEVQCTDGTILPRWLHGFNGTNAPECLAFAQESQTLVNPLDGVYTYRAGFALEQFILYNRYSNNSVQSFRCEPGEVAVGFGARSNCVSLVDPKIFCVERSEVELAGKEIAAPTSGHWRAVSMLILCSIVFLTTLAASCLMVCVWLRRRSQEDRSKYSELSDEIEMHECNVSADSLPVRLPSEGLRAVPLCEGLADIDCIQVAPIPAFTYNSSAESLNYLPEDYLSWKIGPANLEILYKNNRPMLLGSGGFGVVVLAMYYNVQAAVKVLQGGSPSRNAQFLHEINNLQRASKFTQIVQFYGYCAHEDKLCIVMEYMDRGDLFGRIRAKDQNVHWHYRGLDIIQQIASGLRYLHSIGLAHLDLSSRNILLNSRGQAKITDVAIGKLVESMYAEYMAPIVESAAWCAPERRGLGGRCGLPSDIWSLGTILWEICKMEAPSRNDQLSPLKIPKEASQEVADMINQCRASNPADRPTIGAFCDWLNLQQSVM